ncbi:Cdk-activating kinase assembly factor [Parasponia andersonii]|uniref:Cdk-activating kinase assembly factor n=1 Tax=Parasponia andersonii TaxID=3476 RepID=A0A2P5DCV0_PARAD|nr:Cdk-activating kinase assembly factor [Parasponia andersonii]
MEASGNASEPYHANTGGGAGSTSPRRGVGVLQQLPALNFFQSPLSFVLEYSGVVPGRSAHRGRDDQAVNAGAAVPDSPPPAPPCAGGGTSGGGGVDPAEVSIRIIGGGEQEEGEDRSFSSRVGEGGGEGGGGGVDGDGGSLRMAAALDDDDQPGSARIAEASGRAPLVSLSSAVSVPGAPSLQDDSSYQSYDIQQIAKWIEQILPFSILLLVVFIRQHLLGFFVTLWISAVMFKSNDIIRRQTALKGERKTYILVGIFIAFMLHVVGIYWWFQNDDLLYPLFMLPPKEIPPFWHVNAVGDLCAICQEKMHAPILLRCKHIFCEDCVSEWFERERTCPLCRALVKPQDLRTFGDGSTNLLFQLF